MKKGIALVLVLMCCAWVALPALAEEVPAFDYTLLEGKDGYSYDKFDKTWSYMGLYIDPASTSVLALQITGANNTLQSPPSLAVFTGDAGRMESLDFLIGETMTSFDLPSTVKDNLPESCAIVYLGSNEVDFVRALIDAEEFSVRFVGENKKVAFDISKEQYATSAFQGITSTFKEVLESVVQYQLWNDTYWSKNAKSMYILSKPVITVH